MQPNRIAVLTALVASVASAAVALLGAVDTTAKAIVLSVAIFVFGLVIIVWLFGWQRYEAQKARLGERLAREAEKTERASWR